MYTRVPLMKSLVNTRIRSRASSVNMLMRWERAGRADGVPERLL